MNLSSSSQLPQSIADELAAIPGVLAVVLGGSQARGTADPKSDIDLGIYYDPENRPSLDTLREVAARLDDKGSGEVITDFGGWGAWINGGGWLTIQGQAVDWLYRDYGLVKQVIEECHAGNPRIFYQPGHPHGFWTTIYMGEVHLCQPLYDRDGKLAELKALTTPYPPLLKKAMIDRMWEAQFALDTIRKSAARGDVLHVSGSLFRCGATLAQTLYALNERYCINEKGAVREAATFPICPPDWEATIARVLGRPGQNAAELVESIEVMEALVNAIRMLAAQVGKAVI